VYVCLAACADSSVGLVVPALLWLGAQDRQARPLAWTLALLTPVPLLLFSLAVALQHFGSNFTEGASKYLDYSLFWNGYPLRLAYRIGSHLGLAPPLLALPALPTLLRERHTCRAWLMVLLSLSVIESIFIPKMVDPHDFTLLYLAAPVAILASATFCRLSKPLAAVAVAITALVGAWFTPPLFADQTNVLPLVQAIRNNGQGHRDLLLALHPITAWYLQSEDFVALDYFWSVDTSSTHLLDRLAPFMQDTEYDRIFLFKRSLEGFQDSLLPALDPHHRWHLVPGPGPDIVEWDRI
jgi:hypothetical protein